MNQSEAGPSRPTPPRLKHSSSDEPQIIETTTASRRPQRIPRKVSAGTSNPSKPRTKKPTLEKGRGKGKDKAKGKEVETILVDESTDEDEPIFVGVASKLAKKYTFKSTSTISSTSTGTTPIVIPDTGAESDKPKPAPLILHPPLSPQGKPSAIPAWLGKSSILLQIPYCVVCKLRWKKENGAARWVSLFYGPCCGWMSRDQSMS